MPDHFENTDDWPVNGETGMSEIERLIASAGNCVTVSPDFRPAVVETAKERGADRRLCWRVFAVAMAAVFCFMVGASVSARWDPLANPSLQRIERAMTGSDFDSVHPDRREWALADAFVRWRHGLTSRVPDSAQSDSSDTLRRQ